MYVHMHVVDIDDTYVYIYVEMYTYVKGRSEIVFVTLEYFQKTCMYLCSGYVCVYVWKCVYIKKVDVRSCLTYWSISGRCVYIYMYLCRGFVCIHMWKCLYVKKEDVRSCLSFWSISERYAHT